MDIQKKIEIQKINSQMFQNDIQKNKAIADIKFDSLFSLLCGVSMGGIVGTIAGFQYAYEQACLNNDLIEQSTNTLNNVFFNNIVSNIDANVIFNGTYLGMVAGFSVLFLGLSLPNFAKIHKLKTLNKGLKKNLKQITYKEKNI